MFYNRKLASVVKIIENVASSTLHVQGVVFSTLSIITYTLSLANPCLRLRGLREKEVHYVGLKHDTEEN